jgi:hypothetical protein
VEIRFTQAARRHRIGRFSVRHVMASTTPVSTVTVQGNLGWLYVGLDERDRELEILAVEVGEPETYLLVVHVMPTTLRRGT